MTPDQALRHAWIHEPRNLKAQPRLQTLRKTSFCFPSEFRKDKVQAQHHLGKKGTAPRVAHSVFIIPGSQVALENHMSISLSSALINYSGFITTSQTFLFFFFKDFFGVDHLFSLLNLLQHCLLLFFFFFLCVEFWLQGMWDPSSPAGNLTRSPCTGRQSPNHWTSSGSPGLPFLLLGVFLFQETCLWLGSPFFPLSSLGISIFLLSSILFPLRFSQSVLLCVPYPINFLPDRLQNYANIFYMQYNLGVMYLITGVRISGINSGPTTHQE